MHMFSTGTTAWIITQLLVAPGMLGPQYTGQPEDETPAARFDRGMSRVVLPSFCNWAPPRLKFLTSKNKVKSEQWLHLVPLLPVLLFDAYRIGDSVPDRSMPRGNRKTKFYANQQRGARNVLKHRQRIEKHQPDLLDEPPTLENCAASRDVRPLLRNILRYCVAHSIIHSNSITPATAQLAVDLLTRCAACFARMNYHLNPSFHIGSHFEYFVHKYGCARNTWCYSYERMNKVLKNTNHNGHGLGTLETSMLRGSIRKTEGIRLLRHMQNLPNPTADDRATIELMLKAIRTGPERETYREMLDEVLAGDLPFQSQERVRLSSSCAKVNFQQVPVHWGLVCRHITSQTHGIVVYARGVGPENGARLQAKGSTVSHSHLLHDGIKFGVAGHAHGNSARFGFIRGNIPVIIRQIYKSSIRVEGELRDFTTVLVQRFRRHPTHPNPFFLWREWNDYTHIQAWAEDSYEDLEAVNATDLTGTFALYPLELSHGAYWLTVAMKPVSPQNLE
ncbi:Transposase family Tnp2 protein [Ceratobasidium sp. AG-Ba]|nr:Transposase family Tnp2 protein [Ceratobasidium sp. AG-Ba]